MSQPTIAVCAVQGAFIEHERRLAALGCNTFELRQASDLKQPFDALVLPGGESTVQAKLLRELDMFDTLRTRIEDGLPVLGTCAGLILLAERIEEDGGDLEGLDPEIAAVRTTVCGFGTLPVTVRRNGYGRQLGSFHTQAPFGGATSVSPSESDAHSLATPTAPAAPVIPMTFIRAPFITEVNTPEEQTSPSTAAANVPATAVTSEATSIRVLARVDDRIVAVQSQNQIGVAFHPELDEDNTVYQEFLHLI